MQQQRNCNILLVKKMYYIPLFTFLHAHVNKKKQIIYINYHSFCKYLYRNVFIKDICYFM